MTSEATAMYDRMIALLQAAREAAVDAHGDDADIQEETLLEVTDAVGKAIAKTWIPEIVTYCLTCLAMFDEPDGMHCPTCGAVLA